MSLFAFVLAITEALAASAAHFLTGMTGRSPFHAQAVR